MSPPECRTLKDFSTCFLSTGRAEATDLSENRALGVDIADPFPRWRFQAGEVQATFFSLPLPNINPITPQLLRRVFPHRPWVHDVPPPAGLLDAF